MEYNSNWDVTQNGMSLKLKKKKIGKVENSNISNGASIGQILI